MMKLPKELQKKHKTKKNKNYPANRKIDIDKKLIGNNVAQQLGPFLMQQQKNLMMTKNLLGRKEHKEFLKEIESIHPSIKSDIQEKINELEGILKKYNPIHLLHFLCTRHSFHNPETYKESETVSMEIWIEYALSFATSVQPNSTMESPNEEIYDRFEELIIDIIELCRQYYMTEGLIGSTDQIIRSIRFQFILRYLGSRGDSYENHHLDLVLQTFQPHDAFLQENYGFSTEEIIDFINNIRSEINDNIGPYKKQKDFVLKFQELAIKYKESKGDKSEVITEEDLKEFNKNEEMKALREEYWEYTKNLKPFYFKLQPSEKLPLALLELFSAKFGENTPFQQREAFWPLNNSIIYTRPIIEHNKEYYGFGSTLFYRNVINILESLIQEKSLDYYTNKFLKKKAKTLENLSLKYLKNIMPNGKVYEELFYEIEENDEKRRYETDGLIIFDENLFIIEAKAHKLTLSARRGSILRIEKTAKKIIDYAYTQGIRCKKYIFECKKARFYDKDGNEVVSINSDDFRSIYLINTTFENLSHLSTQLHDLKAFKFLEGREWPWTVFINDLRIISEIIECPSIFILYLQRRIRMNDLELFMSSDELDYFMFFLKKGLYFEDIKLSKKQKLGVLGLTDELDRYYLYLNGYIPKAEKPIFNIPNFYKKIVKNLENSKRKGFTLATISLLGLDSRDHKLFSKLIKKYKDLSFKTGKDYKMLFYYKKPSIGLMIITRTNISVKDWSEFREFLEIYMYIYKLKLGIMYKCVYDKRSDVIPNINFEIIEKEWKFNSTLDRKSKKFNFKGMRTVKG